MPNSFAAGVPRNPAPSGQTILLTGGAGFIAAALAERLATDNHLILLDQSFDGQPIEFSAVAKHKNVERLRGDVLDADGVAEAVDRATMVFHMAAVVGVRRVLNDARGTLITNFQGTANVLAACERQPKLSRLIYFSTSEVFGMNSFRVGELMPSSIGPVTEARWSYSISKLAGEHLLAAYHRETGLPTVIIRPFNVFGPGRTGDHAMLRFVAAALGNEDLVVHGNGSQIRSWCYIDDFCDGVIQACTAENAIGQDFNLGNARNTLTMYMLAQRVVSVLGSSSQIRFEAIDFSDIDIRVPSLTKAAKLLGFDPKVEIDDAIRRTADWCRNHLARIRPSLQKVSERVAWRTEPAAFRTATSSPSK